MGIAGLLKWLSIGECLDEGVHVSEYRGEVVAVDTLCWLHKGTYSCALELCTGVPTDGYIKYCMDRVQALLNWGVKPLMVFDGANLPMKGGTEKGRHESREKNRKKGMRLLAAGNRAGALKAFAKAVDVTPEMGHRLINELRRKGVPFIVAPYEADAQLAFLAQTRQVYAVISEDSDMVPFKCHRVMFKMERDGVGQEYKKSNMLAAERVRMEHFTEDMILLMCIMCGCDYLPSLMGLGIKTVYRLVSRHKEAGRVFRELGSKVTDEYRAGYERARLTFLHQRVYDPRSREMVNLTPLPDGAIEAAGMADSDFLGPYLPPETARAIAESMIHPTTHEPYPDAIPMQVSCVGDEGKEGEETAAVGDSGAADAEPRRCANGGPGAAPVAVKRARAQPERIDTFFDQAIAAKAAKSERVDRFFSPVDIGGAGKPIPPEPQATEAVRLPFKRPRMSKNSDATSDASASAAAAEAAQPLRRPASLGRSSTTPGSAGPQPPQLTTSKYFGAASPTETPTTVLSTATDLRRSAGALQRGSSVPTYGATPSPFARHVAALRPNSPFDIGVSPAPISSGSSRSSVTTPKHSSEHAAVVKSDPFAAFAYTPKSSAPAGVAWSKHDGARASSRSALRASPIATTSDNVAAKTRPLSLSVARHQGRSRRASTGSLGQQLQSPLVSPTLTPLSNRSGPYTPLGPAKPVSIDLARFRHTGTRARHSTPVEVRDVEKVRNAREMAFYAHPGRRLTDGSRLSGVASGGREEASRTRAEPARRV